MNNPIPKLISLVYFKSVVVWKPPLTAGFWPLQDCHFWASYAARDRHVEGSSILDFMRLAAYRCHSCKLCKLWAFPHMSSLYSSTIGWFRKFAWFKSEEEQNSPRAWRVMFHGHFRIIPCDFSNLEQIHWRQALVLLRKYMAQLPPASPPKKL